MCYPAKPNQQYRCECHMVFNRPGPAYESPEWYAARDRARRDPLGRTSIFDGVDLVELGRQLAMSKGKKRRAKRQKAMDAHPSNFRREA